MDRWAPIVRYAADGTGLLTNDAGTVAVAGTTGGRRFQATSTDTDTAAHASVGAVWTDAYGEVTLPNVPTASANLRWGCWLRVTDSSNCYTLQVDGGGTFTIAKVVAGTPTTLLTASYTLGPSTGFPCVFRGEAQGEQLRGFWRGRLIGSVTDATIITPGFVSMMMRSDFAGSDTEINIFEAGPLTASYVADSGGLTQQAGPSRRQRLGR